MIYRKVANMDPEEMINTDQMPIPYSFLQIQFWKKSTKTIHARYSTSGTTCAILASTVSGSSKLLLPCSFSKAN
jgi:hypothetical protein